ncbi:hypothetical protein P154DRAFT_539788 [Amniculicola lignicola CBS 123094]|uniref:Uncharacterized protein n=1 Tax=Amniculicola lignicola CBS 123094 TaxID=1392246 RepID=A0A6A5VYX7_9PLEO|nr:hypothetical protein P154DRAFT_539788 [Amniculicola lignicola CBS 123094]
MCERLPRELRDIVYFYIWDREGTKLFNQLIVDYQAKNDQFFGASVAGPQCAYESLWWLYQKVPAIAAHTEDASFFLHTLLKSFMDNPSEIKLKALTVVTISLYM